MASALPRFEGKITIKLLSWTYLPSVVHFSYINLPTILLTYHFSYIYLLTYLGLSIFLTPNPPGL